MKFIFLNLYYSGERILINISEVKFFQKIQDPINPTMYKTRVNFVGGEYLEVSQSIGAIGDMT